LIILLIPVKIHPEFSNTSTKRCKFVSKLSFRYSNLISTKMKKHLTLLSLFIFVITFSAFAKKVEIRNAQLVAKNFYFEHISQKSVTPYQSISVTNQYVEKYNNEPVYYVLTINDGGFIIVAADDAVTPIIGYSFSGPFVSENQPENFTAWMDHYKQEINYVREQNLQPDEAIISSWTHLSTTNSNELTPYRSTTDVAPLLLNITWDQGFPYNAMCPADPAGTEGHTIVGCVATAMAQIMCYWRYPNTGQGYHCIFPIPSYGSQCADFSSANYDWNGATDKPTKECDLAALISYHAGIAVDMSYGVDESGAYMTKVAPAFKNYFKYASSASLVYRGSDYETWKNTIRGDLDNGLPVQYSGSEPSGGHSWVCDGYEGTDYFHMNWGWSGSDNGNFTLNTLNPSGYSFNSNQQACIHIQPDPAQYPTYCTGTNNVSTYDFGSIEDGSGPVANYQGNANCSWLINVDDSVKTVTLDFDRFELNASDFVKVYNGINASAPLLGSFSGTALPSSVTSTGPQMFITFTSASGSTANGFSATYSTSLANFCSINSTLTATEGTFGDGSDRFQYRNGQMCRWSITPPGAKTITLSFNDFHTESDKDFVKVFDLANTTTPLAIISGDYSTPPADVTSPSSGMMVLFTSNSTVRGQGWNVTYSITVGTDESRAFENLAVYPNPSNGVLYIDFNINDIQKLKIELVSIQGMVVYSETHDNFKGAFHKQIDLSSVSKGVYMLRMTSDQGISTKKIILQ
jgi:hypothetical protein